jgi:hypothetical protein
MESVSFLTDGAGSTNSATVQSGASTLSPFRSMDVDHRINGTPGAISNGSFRSRLGGPSRGRVSLGSGSRPVDPLDPPAEPLQPAPPDRRKRDRLLKRVSPCGMRRRGTHPAPGHVHRRRHSGSTRAMDYVNQKPPGHPLRRRSRHEEPGACYLYARALAEPSSRRLPMSSDNRQTATLPPSCPGSGRRSQLSAQAQARQL